MSAIDKILNAIPAILVGERERIYPKPIEFADRLGVTRQRLSEMEQNFLRGGKPGFEWATLLRYAKALGEGEEKKTVMEDSENNDGTT